MQLWSVAHFHPHFWVGATANPPKSGVAISFHSIPVYFSFFQNQKLLFPFIFIAISFHFFIPQKTKWKEIAISKLLFPSTFILISKIAITFHFSLMNEIASTSTEIGSLLISDHLRFENQTYRKEYECINCFFHKSVMAKLSII
jgi:hypothetical protein